MNIITIDKQSKKQIEINKLIKEYNTQANNIHKAKTKEAKAVLIELLNVIASSIEKLQQEKRAIK